MAISKEQVEVAQCDGCGKIRYGTGLPGLVGTVTATGRDGGPQSVTTFHSCSMAPGHIGKAILNALAAAPAPEHVADSGLFQVGGMNEVPPPGADLAADEYEYDRT